jgi:hypothetical protein
VDYLFWVQTMGLLGLRIRYWIVIIIVIIIIAVVAYMARGRAA